MEEKIIIKARPLRIVLWSVVFSLIIVAISAGFVLLENGIYEYESYIEHRHDIYCLKNKAINDAVVKYQANYRWNPLRDTDDVYSNKMFHNMLIQEGYYKSDSNLKCPYSMFNTTEDYILNEMMLNNFYIYRGNTIMLALMSGVGILLSIVVAICLRSKLTVTENRIIGKRKDKFDILLENITHVRKSGRYSLTIEHTEGIIEFKLIDNVDRIYKMFEVILPENVLRPKILPQKINKDISFYYCKLSNYILLSIFTFGIWQMVWIYRVTRCLNRVETVRRKPLNQMLLCVFIPFYVIWWFRKSALLLKILENEKELSSNASVTAPIMAAIFPLFAVLILQDRINTIITTR